MSFRVEVDGESVRDAFVRLAERVSQSILIEGWRRPGEWQITANVEGVDGRIKVSATVMRLPDR